MARHMTRVLFGTACVAFPLIFAASVKSNQETGYMLDHKTLYISPDIDDAHRFELKGAIKGDKGMGTLIVDKNTCKLNEFGDRTLCTEVEYAPGPVEFSRLRLADPAMQGREVYSVSGAGVPKGITMTLAIGRKSSPEVLRLVVSCDAKRSAFPLVPRVEYDEAP
jgi:hypothetical protein